MTAAGQPEQSTLVPPPDMIRRIGGGRGGAKVFLREGQRVLRFMTERCRLEPHERVLDVGCGVGRIAIPLTQYLSAEGGYDGFDVWPQGVQWCQENITPRHPNFTFRVADVANTQYNPDGAIDAQEFRFPYPDEAFEYVVLTSVFTHMLPAGMEHYLGEIRRVLKPDVGRVAATFYLLNDRSLERLRLPDARPRFRHDLGDHMVTRLDAPEAVVAYREDFVAELYARNRFEIDPPIEYGWWVAGRPAPLYQDAVVAYCRAGSARGD